MNLRSDPAERMGSVIVKIRHPGNLDADFSSSQKAMLTFNIEDVASRDGDAATSQFQNLTSGFILHRHYSDLRPAGRENQHVQAEIGDNSRRGVEQLLQL